MSMEDIYKFFENPKSKNNFDKEKRYNLFKIFIDRWIIQMVTNNLNSTYMAKKNIDLITEAIFQMFT